MNSYLKTYTITLTALSPVHIGSGEKIGKKEYIFDKQTNEVHYPDSVRLFSALKSKGIDDFLLKDGGDLYGFLNRNGIDYRQFIKETVTMQGGADYTFNEIHTFIKDAYGLPYIPGSSIKGAFRTVILNSEAKKARLNGKNYTLPDVRFIRKFPRETKDIETELLNTLNRKENRQSDAVNDVMAAFRFSDSQPISRDMLTICRKIDQPFAKSKKCEPKKLPTYRECLKPETEIKLTLTVDTKLLSGKKYADLFENGGAKFIKCLKDFNALYDQEYLVNFDELSPNYDDAIYLGGGTGFLTKTVLLGAVDKAKRLRFTSEYLNKRFNKHRHDEDMALGVSPRMLKIAVFGGRLFEMGKCKVEITEI